MTSSASGATAATVPIMIGSTMRGLVTLPLASRGAPMSPGIAPWPSLTKLTAPAPSSARAIGRLSSVWVVSPLVVMNIVATMARLVSSGESDSRQARRDILTR